MIELRRTKFLVLAAAITFSAIAIGWYVIMLERQSAALGYCRRLNLNNIFVYNALVGTAPGSRVDPALVAAVLPPEVCARWIARDSQTSKDIEAYRQRTTAMTVEEYEALAGPILPGLGETYNSLENGLSTRQFYALVGVAILNVIALAAQATHLRRELRSKE